MCLGIPGRVIEIREIEGVRMGTVDFAGISKEVCLAYVPEVEVGDYTIVHVGFAITMLDEESAQESLRLFKELGAFDAEFGQDALAANDELAADRAPAAASNLSPQP